MFLSAVKRVLFLLPGNFLAIGACECCELMTGKIPAFEDMFSISAILRRFTTIHEISKYSKLEFGTLEGLPQLANCISTLGYIKA